MRRFTFAGESFELDPRDPTWPINKFLAATGRMGRGELSAQDGAKASAAMDALLRALIAPHEWERFEEHLDAERPGEDALENLLADVLEAVLSEETGRPTVQPSDSSGGLPQTVDSSTGGSSSQVIARLEGQGRPDLALFVTRAQESLAG